MVYVWVIKDSGGWCKIGGMMGIEDKKKARRLGRALVLLLRITQS